MPHPVLTTRALKCTVLLDPGEVEALVLVEGMPRVQLNVRTADGSRTVTADIAALLQGKLGMGDVLLEAGLVCQVKIQRPAAMETAA
jgi:hypothetical protein